MPHTSTQKCRLNNPNTSRCNTNERRFHTAACKFPCEMKTVLEIIIAGLLILFMGGMCFDWICSGSINPIYEDENKSTTQETFPTRSTYRTPSTKEGMIRLICPTCRLNSEYDIILADAQGYVKCKRCEQIINHKDTIEV